MTLTELQKEIYSINKANGWHDKVPSKLEQHALFHTEITEAYNEFIAGRLETWYQEDGKPEGYYTELADVVIRILDYFSLDGWTYNSEQENPYSWSATDGATFTLVLHGEICNATEQVRANKQMNEAIVLNYIILFIDAFLASNSQSLTDLIAEKIAYNKTRGYRYGGKVI